MTQDSPYTLETPTGRLAEYVRAIWTLDVPGELSVGTEQPIVPDGCPELVFNLGDPIHRLRGASHDVHDRPQLAGQLTRAITVRPQGRMALVGIRLHPWAMQALVGVGAREMRGNIIPAESALGRALYSELDDLDRRLPPREFAGAVVQALARYIGRRPLPNSAALTVHRAIGHGNPETSVRSLARSLGRSERHIQRVFEESVGLSPKTYLRLTRVQRALQLAERAPSRSWAEISAMCDFHDQPHLIRELREIAGCTPTQFDERAGILTRSLVG